MTLPEMLTVSFERATPKTVGYGVCDPVSSFFYKWYDIVVNVKILHIWALKG